MMTRSIVFAIVAAGLGGLWGSEPVVPRFSAGDNVVVIGDSITHNGRWLRELLVFYATRFPGQRFEVSNCGLSGDNAAGALRRFDRDIAPHHPRIALVMLGMNDVGRNHYGSQRESLAAKASQEKCLADYRTNMDNVLTRLRDLGARLVVITPSPYDQTGNQAQANLMGVNDGLFRCAVHVKALAATHNAAVIDLHGPMTSLNAMIQGKDPNQTIIGPDRVHPGEPGHLLMAYLVLRAQRMESMVSSITVDAGTGKAVAAEGAQVYEVQAGPQEISFTVLARSLPFPVPAAARQALSWVPFMADLNREIVQVRGLKPGRYVLDIDGNPVCSLSAEDAASGIDLSDQSKTPQYQQALTVRAAAERHFALVGRLRTLEAMWHFTLSKIPGLREDDGPAVEKALVDAEALFTVQKHTYGIWQIGQYRLDAPRRMSIAAEAAAATEAMWSSAVPRPHRYRITPAPQ